MTRPINADTQRMLNKLEAMWTAWKPGSPEFKRAFYLIGIRLQGQARHNARSQKIGNTGRLVNSITFTPRDRGIIFGVFGVHYAKYHEYGGRWTDENRKAMFAGMRETGQKPRPSKGVVKNGWLTARPFIEPAIEKNRGYIIDQIRMIGAPKK